MAKILFVSKSELSIEFAQLFKEAGYTVFAQVKSANEAKRIANEKEIDLVVINTPLTDEFGHDLALSIENKVFTNTIIFVNSELVDAVEQKMFGSTVIVMAKPVSKKTLYKTLGYFTAQQQKMAKVLDENLRLQEKLEEYKLVARAKMLLMEKNKMSEEMAHKHIDRTSKDQRRTKKDVAKSIIDMYN